MHSHFIRTDTSWLHIILSIHEYTRNIGFPVWLSSVGSFPMDSNFRRCSKFGVVLVSMKN